MAAPAPSSGEPASGGPDPHIDSSGRYLVGAELSYLVIGTYLFLLLIVVFVVPRSTVSGSDWLAWAIAVLILFFLGRYLSTGYSIDSDQLHAFRILGGRRVALEQVRQIQYASLHDLSPTGFFGSWGYRGRMWSPVVGRFDSVHTAANGILVVAGDVPLFISPKHPQEFARELSRRVRSYRGPLEADDSQPPSGAGAID